MKKNKEKGIMYFIWFLVILVVAVGIWVIVDKFNVAKNEPYPYTIYNDYVIYEIKDDKSLRYLVDVYANGGNKYSHYFKVYPTDLLNIPYEEGIKNKILYKNFNNGLKKDKIYFSYDPIMDGSEILSSGTLIQILGNSNSGVYKIPVVVSMTKDDGNSDFPIKTCDDATQEVGVIELRYGEPKIYSDGECVIIQGNNREEFINVNDLLSYVLLGVVE